MALAARLGVGVRDGAVDINRLGKIDGKLRHMADKQIEDNELTARFSEGVAYARIHQMEPHQRKEIEEMVGEAFVSKGDPKDQKTGPYSDLTTAELEGARRVLRTQLQGPGQNWAKKETELVHQEFDARRRDPDLAATVLSVQRSYDVVDSLGEGVTRVNDRAQANRALARETKSMVAGYARHVHVADKAPSKEGEVEGSVKERLARMAVDRQIAAALEAAGDKGRAEAAREAGDRVESELKSQGVPVGRIVRQSEAEGRSLVELAPGAAKNEYRVQGERLRINEDAMAKLTQSSKGASFER